MYPCCWAALVVFSVVGPGYPIRTFNSRHATSQSSCTLYLTDNLDSSTSFAKFLAWDKNLLMCTKHKGPYTWRRKFAKKPGSVAYDRVMKCKFEGIGGLFWSCVQGLIEHLFLVRKLFSVLRLYPDQTFPNQLIDICAQHM